MRVSGSPFVGLDFFVEDDTAFFFGRDAERQRIAGNLRTARLTLLYAESGVGKSSLLRAGVAARLREAEHGYAPGRVQPVGREAVERLIAEIASAAGGNGDRPAIRDDSLEHALEDVAEHDARHPSRDPRSVRGALSVQRRGRRALRRGARAVCQPA